MSNDFDELLVLSNPVFASYIFYTTASLVKMLLLVPLTARHRLGRGIFANKEDTVLHNKGQVNLVDEELEQVRRAHLSDLENITIFALLGLFHVMTAPAPASAIWHFRLFSVARVVHTLTLFDTSVYSHVCRQLSIGASFALTTSLAVRNLACCLL